MGHHLILYDGVCGLCNRFTRFVLDRDEKGQFHFAPLQGKTAPSILSGYGQDPALLDTVYVVANHGQSGERLLTRSDAIRFVLATLGGFFSLAWLLGLVPRRLLDAGYRWLARRRYRWFGRTDECVVPSKEVRARFLD